MSNYSEKSNGEAFHRRSTSPVRRRSPELKRFRSRSPPSRSRHYPPDSKRLQQHQRSSRYDRSRSRSPLSTPGHFSLHHRSTIFAKARAEDELARYNAPENNVLAIFGLSKRVIEQDLFDSYKHFGCKECKVIMDKHTGFPKGYGFVYFSRVKDAIIAREKTNGKLLFGKPMRVDFSIGERDYSSLSLAAPAPFIRPTSRLYRERDIRDSLRESRSIRESRYLPGHQHPYHHPLTRDLRMPRDSISSYYHDQHHNHHRSAHYVRGGSLSRDHNSRHSPFNDQRHGYSGRRGETGDRRRIATPPLPSNSYQSSEAENHRSHYANERSRSRTPRESRKHHKQSRDLNQDTRIFQKSSNSAERSQ